MDGVAIVGSSELDSSSQQWRPLKLAFQHYVPGSNASSSSLNSSQMPARRRVLRRLTKDIIETYKICNPKFKFLEGLNPKLALTSPSIGVLNDGYDNVNSDLILSFNCNLINAKTQRRYIVKALLGHGTFGQVAKCWVPDTNNFIAVKIIKNLPAYYQQAQVEVSILMTLNQKFDPEDKHHIVRIYDCFVHQQHLCICFELLDSNLYELIKMNQFRGLPLNIVQRFSKQILHGLALLKDAAIIHCDLKPENILLTTSVKKSEIKIIDFGSACMEGRTVYSYIQSRYYRSPEVLLGCQYSTAIDMWSFGCIVAELFLGLPLFPGSSEFDLLRRMIEILGKQPPDHLLKDAKNLNKFFKCIGNIHSSEKPEINANKSAYRALSIEEFEARDSKRPSIGKEYFQRMNLEAIVKNYPYRKNLHPEEILKESETRLALIDFLRGLVEFDPTRRWSPFQASRHPFITGEPFTRSYTPLAETRVPVAQTITVDHHPGGGHWFPSGLSPNVSVRNRAPLHNASHFQAIPYTHASSYGSIGSHGSSYGSYGDSGNMFAYYSPVGPSGIYMHPQSGVPLLGSSPDARRRMIHYNHGNGLGISPSSNFAPLPLGSSPSQFTPPATYSQIPASSSGHYGPPSPRSNCHGSPLGKLSSSSQFSRRKNMGFQGGSQFSECSSSSHWHGQFSDSNLPPSIGNSPLNRQHIPANSNWIPQGVGEEIPSSQNENNETLLDPGDWDPNYSDDQLLQESGAESGSLNTEFLRVVNLGSSNSPTNSNWLVQRPNWSGQHPPQFNHGRGLARIGEWNHLPIPSSPTSYSSGGSVSPGSGPFVNMPWGRRNSYPVANIPPSHGRKEQGRFS